MIEQALYKITRFFAQTRLRSNNRLFARILQEIGITFLHIWQYAWVKQLNEELK
jgi:hypothetical protein